MFKITIKLVPYYKKNIAINNKNKANFNLLY